MVPAEKQNTGKTKKCKRRFTNSVRFLASSLSSLADNLAEGLCKGKCKYCKASPEYTTAKYGLLTCVCATAKLMRKSLMKIYPSYSKTHISPVMETLTNSISYCGNVLILISTWVLRKIQ